MFIQLQEVIISSAPSFRKRDRGRRLTIKAYLTAVFTWDTDQSGLLG